MMGFHENFIMIFQQEKAQQSGDFPGEKKSIAKPFCWSQAASPPVVRKPSVAAPEPLRRPKLFSIPLGDTAPKKPAGSLTSQVVRY